MKKTYKLGNLVFTIKGEDKVLPHLRMELAPIETTKGDKPDIEFNFSAPPLHIENGIFVSPVVCSPNELFYHGKGFKYYLTKENNSFHVTIQSSPISKKASWFPKIKQLKDWNFLLPMEQRAKNFMYDIFDYISQIKNLDKRQSYIHAGSFVKEHNGVAVIAWGGVGKTTAMLKLVKEDNWDFLSDDLGIIDENGFIYRSPKKMQIYAYNLEGQPHFKDMLMKGRGLIDKTNWFYKKHRKGLKGVRRRVSAEDLFGQNSVAKKAKLKEAIFIERANIEDFKRQTLSLEALARRAATTIMNEINPYQEIETAVYTAQEKMIIPRYEEMLEKTKLILKKALSATNMTLIKIPRKASPDELADYLRIIL